MLLCWILAMVPSSQARQDAADTRQINQGVFNKIEYHFNQRETDSIYAMASPAFQKALSKEALTSVLDQQLYALGQIQSAEMLSFNEPDATGIYRLDFQGATLQMVLGTDANRRFNTLLFQPYQPVEQEDPLPVIRSTKKSLDEFIDSLAFSYTKNSAARALAIGVLQNGKRTHYFYGNVSREDSRLPDDNSLFEIGSISKTFAATLLAYLAETGVLSTKDPIVNFLPDSLASNPYLRQITLEQLANHTSGLPRLPTNIIAHAAKNPQNPYFGYSTEMLYDFLAGYEAEIVPGNQYLYSNLGYAVLGSILSTLTGQTFDEMVQEVIAVPLELRLLTEHPTDSMDVLPVHDQAGNLVAAWDFDAFSAAGSLKSSLGDLLSFVGAHFERPETALENAMARTREFTFFDPPQTDLGLGWHMELRGSDLVYWHNGETGGSNSFTAFSPDKRIAVVVLANAKVSVATIARNIQEFLLKP